MGEGMEVFTGVFRAGRQQAKERAKTDTDFRKKYRPEITIIEGLISNNQMLQSKAEEAYLALPTKRQKIVKTALAELRDK